MSVNELNNTAIALFQRGYHFDAIVCLRAAIDRLLGTTRNQPIMPTASYLNRWVLDERNLQIGRQQRQRCQDHEKNCFMSLVSIEHPSMAREEHVASSMYSSLVLLSDSSQELMESYLDQTSVVLLYNLAIINHWRALHVGSAKGLVKALKLYEMALEIVHENQVDKIERLSLAMWNNMGHIHTQMFQLNEARVCFSSLCLLLQDRSDIRQQLSTGEFENFLLSAISQAGELHLAPAA